jgi:hypothetical protein
MTLENKPSCRGKREGTHATERDGEGEREGERERERERENSATAGASIMNSVLI